MPKLNFSCETFLNPACSNIVKKAVPSGKAITLSFK
jgi:hypothetical protein